MELSRREGATLFARAPFRAFYYDANDERVLRYRFEQDTDELISPGDARWGMRAGGAIWNPTLRDERGQVLVDRRQGDGIQGTELETYVWRGDALLGSELQPQGQVRYFALDHLGSVRAIADGAGSLVETRWYEPYGYNPKPVTLDERRAWAGHEREYGELAKPHDDLDYMHARFYKPAWGRFLSVDPVLVANRAMSEPQGWNRYSYTLGNPLRFIDPDGRETVSVNRRLGGGPPRGLWAPLSHTFVATTSGGLHTYSWGNTADGKTQGRWFLDRPEDLAAAQAALATGMATVVGDDTLDPFVQQAFLEVFNKPNDRSNHPNPGFAYNCKFEAVKLLERAIELRDAQAEQPQKVEPEPQDQDKVKRADKKRLESE